MTNVSFSVVIPTFNRPEQLARCLQALADQAYPRDRFEVIVVDDGSPSLPSDVVAALQDGVDISLLCQHNAGPAAARNRGASGSRGRFLAFTDDDCMPDRLWLATLAEYLSARPDSMVGGRTVNALPANPYASVSQLIVDVVYAYYNSGSGARFFASNNLVLPAARFHRIGGFDALRFPFASEDRDFCDRWMQQGERMVYAPEAVVQHAHTLDLRAFWRQHYRYGQGAYRFHRASARRHRSHNVVDRRFYLSLPRLVRNFLDPTPARRARAAILLLVLWQLANAEGYLSEWAANLGSQQRQGLPANALDTIGDAVIE